MKIVTIHNDPANFLTRDLTYHLTTCEEAIAVKKEMDAVMGSFEAGIGLAANQVGVELNLFLVAGRAKLLKGGANEMCIQPSYEPLEGTAMVQGIESCLSIPGVSFVVPRFAAIRAKWRNTQGHWISRKLTGLPAIVFQHEMDHLRGITLLQTGSVIRRKPPTTP